MNSSRSYNFFYNIMPDGTVKQINPFTGTEVWAVPGRGDKPLMNEIPAVSAKHATTKSLRKKPALSRTVGNIVC
jgi:hypothetical protein